MSGYKRSSWISGVLSDAVGFRGRKNLYAWLVAGTLAYYFYVVPERKKAEEQKLARELARSLAEEKGLLEVDRSVPRPDPQDTGLLKGSKTRKHT
jgi:hypothetical protein